MVLQGTAVDSTQSAKPDYVDYLGDSGVPDFPPFSKQAVYACQCLPAGAVIRGALGRSRLAHLLARRMPSHPAQWCRRIQGRRRRRRRRCLPLPIAVVEGHLAQRSE